MDKHNGLSINSFEFMEQTACPTHYHSMMGTGRKQCLQHLVLLQSHQSGN